jgi:predicted PurR-regulated permease PerM
MAKSIARRKPRRPAPTYFELAIRFGVLGFLLYLAFTLIQPFISILIWSVIVAVALYPLFRWTAEKLGDRKTLAACLVTLLSLVIVFGPAMWLALDLIESVRILSERVNWHELAIPPPPESVKSWAFGAEIHQLWTRAATNTRETLAKIYPYLRPVGTMLIGVAAGTGLSVLNFFISIIVAGFLFVYAPPIVEGMKLLARRLEAERGEEFVMLAGATIRAVSRGVVGIAALQALLAGVGLTVAGVPAASLLTFIILILGIIQIGPSVVIIPLIIWSWFSMDTTAAILFTAYMIPVNLIDNVLRPFVMSVGLRTPMLVIFLGVFGGTIAYGLSGLFVGPIVLAVIWELLVAWINVKKHESAA